MNVSPAIATRGKFSSRLPNSIQVFSVVWPTDCLSTALVFVHAGQSGQPRPDAARRTAHVPRLGGRGPVRAAKARRRQAYRRANQDQPSIANYKIPTPAGQQAFGLL